LKSENTYTIRPALINDVEQIAPLILDCLKGPNGKSNYEVIFKLSHSEVLEMIKNLLKQPITDHEFHYANYLLAEKKGEIISICSGWKEKGQINGSESKRSNLIASYLGLEKWRQSYPMLEEFSQINIPRKAGFLYLENASTNQAHRRSNIAYRLVYNLIKMRKRQFPDLETIHSHVFLSNKIMYNMLVRFHYKVEETKEIPLDSHLMALFPIRGLALVSIPIETYTNNFENHFPEFKID